MDTIRVPREAWHALKRLYLACQSQAAANYENLDGIKVAQGDAHAAMQEARLWFTDSLPAPDHAERVAALRGGHAESLVRLINRPDRPGTSGLSPGRFVRALAARVARG